MKALKKVFVGFSFCLMVLLAACGQNAVLEEALEPHGLPDNSTVAAALIVRGGLLERLAVDHCRLLYPICEMDDRLGQLVQKVTVGIPIIECVKGCNFVVDVNTARKITVGLVMPELGQTPEQFGKAIKVDLLDKTGKVVLAQGQPSLKAPVHEFSATLNTGSYMLRVQVLDMNVLKLIQASPSRYPFSFIVK